MTNRVISWLEHVGHEFHKGLDVSLPFIETAGETAVGIFIPQLGPMFNSTVAAIVTAEQGFTAVGKQSGTGIQKGAAVLGLMRPLIQQALADMGKPNDDAAIEQYIKSVVTILNSLPAPALAAPSSGSAPAVSSAPAAGITAPPAPGVTSEHTSTAADMVFPHP